MEPERLLSLALAVAATARALLRGCAAGVEAEDREPGKRGQTVCCLAKQMAVHHAALRRQGMQANERRLCRPPLRERQLTDER